MKKITAQQRRMTQQRSIILEELRKAAVHPTADEIYQLVRQRLPRVSLGTIYRNLELLAGQGTIRKIEYAGRKRFEGNILPHQHAHCQKCGQVHDIIPPVPLPDIRHVTLPRFTITAACLEFNGLCDACASLL